MNEDEKYFMWVYNLAIEHLQEEISQLPLDDDTLTMILDKMKPVSHVTLAPFDEYDTDDLVNALIESLIASDNLESELLDLNEEEFQVLMQMLQEEQTKDLSPPEVDPVTWEELLDQIEGELEDE